ncbi:MAG: AI-2E family transporter [Anaerolineales bacterium]|nr:AI-2E family transporter [Anaerolineales bacterium]
MNSTNGLTPAIRILLMLAAGSIALWGMSQYASYINAAAIAILIILACGPFVDWLRRKGANRAITLAAALLLSVTVLALFLLFLVYAGAQFAKELPQYQQQAQAMAQQLAAWLQSFGLDQAGAAAISNPTTATAPLDWAGSLISALTSALSNGVTMAMLMIFLFVDVIVFPGRLEWQARHGNGYAERLADFTGGLRQYIVVMVIIGTAIGALNTVLFWIVGVPMPLLWGVLSGILNFIPFIGFWFGLIPPAILTLLAYGWERALLMSIGYILVNGFVQNVIQPRLVVTRLNLTPFWNLVSATFWPLVLGPVGAIIGVPLTMSVRSLVFEADPTTSWLGSMMSTKNPDQEAAAKAEQASKPPKSKKSKK